MKICYFGDFSPGYIRNDVIIQGLRQNGVDVVFCRAESKDPQKFLKLWRQYLSIRGGIDFLIVGSSDTSRWLVLLAKLISRKPLIWNAHYSLFDTFVSDRQLIRPKSIKALYYWFLDWMGCKLADKILLCTNCNINYFVKEFGIKKEKFIKVLIGANEEFLRRHIDGMALADKTQKTGFLVSFHGGFIPLQGIQYIIRAAKILGEYPDIKFNIIGSGQMYATMLELARELGVSNINFIDRVPYEKIPGFIAESDVSLGIFGDSDKAARNIPNKLYEAIALGKTVITADTPGIRELFEDRKNILLCKRADPDDLAAKILELRNNTQLREHIGARAHELFKKFCTSLAVGKKLLKDINHGNVI